MAVTIREVEAQLRALGVRSGSVLLVHTAFRKVRPIEGGPLGLIAALTNVLGSDGTLVMPTMTDGESRFDPASTPSFGMGITAETFWRQTGTFRSTHPGGSFAARGPRAAEICAVQPLSPPHGPDSPPGRVHAMDGQVLLLGVGHGESTVLHVAEAIARVPYSVTHPTVVDDAIVDIAETDHCCRNFEKLDDWLGARALLRRGRVGHAPARLFDARDAVTQAVTRLKRDPLIFLCLAMDGCDECDRARASVRLS